MTSFFKKKYIFFTSQIEIFDILPQDWLGNDTFILLDIAESIIEQSVNADKLGGIRTASSIFWNVGITSSLLKYFLSFPEKTTDKFIREIICDLPLKLDFENMSIDAIFSWYKADHEILSNIDISYKNNDRMCYVALPLNRFDPHDEIDKIMLESLTFEFMRTLGYYRNLKLKLFISRESYDMLQFVNKTHLASGTYDVKLQRPY